jgi:hypothetical protein
VLFASILPIGEVGVNRNSYRAESEGERNINRKGKKEVTQKGKKDPNPYGKAPYAG